MHPLEALRIVTALILIGISIVGSFHVTDGQAAFDYSIRGIMTMRRRVQMLVYGLVGILFLIQAFMAANTPDALGFSNIMIASNIIILLVMALIIALSWVQIKGWLRFQNILLNEPLQPSTKEQLHEAILIARNLGHTTQNNLALVVATIESLNTDKRIPEDIQVELRGITDKLIEASMRTQQLHLRAKELDT